MFADGVEPIRHASQDKYINRNYRINILAVSAKPSASAASVPVMTRATITTKMVTNIGTIEFHQLRVKRKMKRCKFLVLLS